jgi:hypothetical protein
MPSGALHAQTARATATPDTRLTREIARFLPGTRAPLERPSSG